MTVLRDTYINKMLRTAAFLLLLLTCACKQTPSDPATTAVQAAEKEKAATSSVVAAVALSLQSELQSAMSEMNGIFQSAQELHLGNNNGKATTNTENIDAVFEKSGTVLGAMFILQGSIGAVEQRFNEGIIDQKQALEMLNKLSIDLKSYQNDIKGYREMLGDAAKAKPENAKAEK